MLQPQLKQFGKQKWISPSLVFCSIQAFSGLDGAYPHWGGQTALLSPPIQKLCHPKTSLQTYSEKCLAKYLGTLRPSQIDI